MTLQAPTLETDRLILRAPLPQDLEPWIAFMADPDAARFIGGVMNRQTAWRGVCAMTGAWTIQGFSMFSVIEKATGRWVGRLGPWKPHDWPGTEVGWGIVRDAWGRGYAGEGAAAAIDWAFDALGWDEVIHCIDPQNHPSQAVARKLGSSVQRVVAAPAPINGTWEIWGQTRGQWRARKA